MTASIALRIVVGRVGSIDELHYRGNIRLGCLKKQVIVIAHKAIRVEKEFELFLGR